MSSGKYNEQTKALAMAKQRKTRITLRELYAQMVLDEIFINSQKEQLKIEIDQCLENNDRERFYELSEQYAALCR